MLHPDVAALRWLNRLEAPAQEALRNALAAYLQTDQLQDYRAYMKQAEFHALGAHYRNRCLMAGNQLGKSLEKSTPCMTPHGFVPIGDLRVGDHVYGADGRPTQVLGVYPQGMREVYRVSTRDGASVVADGDHLWTVRFGSAKKRPYPWKVRTTREMLAKRSRFQIPPRPLIEYETGGGFELPVDPRLLGLLLGDGTLSRGTIEYCTADAELAQYVRQAVAVYGCTLQNYGWVGANLKAHVYGISNTRDGLTGGKGANELKNRLRALGVMGGNAHTKLVPDAYKRASVSDRLALLTGLMDTDGCAEKKGRRIFVSVSERLARDVLEIVRSLGMNASIRWVDRKVDGVRRPIWRVHIHGGGFPVFGLARKQERERTGWRKKKSMYLTIEPAGRDECTCIKVAAPDGLFLAGEGLIPTHNTHAASAEMAMHCTGEYPRWWRGKRFTRPITAWASSQTADATRDNVQRALLGLPKMEGTGMIPKRCLTSMYGRSSVAPDLYDYRMIRHVSGGFSMLKFRFYEQDRKAWQGPPVDVVWFDEEPYEPIYNEGLARTIKTKGITMMTFTPAQGYTNVVNLYLKDPNPETSSRIAVKMTIFDAQHFTDEERAAEIARWGKNEARFRIYGDPAVGEGLIYPYTEDEVGHDPFVIPDHFAQIAGVDFGGSALTSHPTAAVRLAWDRENDVIYVTREYRRKGLKPPEHWLALRFWGDRLKWAWPRDALVEEKASGDQIIEIYRTEGMRALPMFAQWPVARRANRSGQGGRSGGFGGLVSVERGILDITTRFESERLKIFRTCPMLFEEMRQYHRKDHKIVKQMDDLLDALRYGIMMLRFAEVPDRRRAYTSVPIDGFLGI